MVFYFFAIFYDIKVDIVLFLIIMLMLLNMTEQEAYLEQIYLRCQLGLKKLGDINKKELIDFQRKKLAEKG